MANYTSNLNLRLPLGSKYWNSDTWNNNMKKLDEAYLNIREIVLTNLSADDITVSNARLDATNMQNAIDELVARESALYFVTVTDDVTLRVSAEGHTYYVLTFGESVPTVNFQKVPATSSRSLTWLNGPPTFEPNSIFEISILKMGAIWYKRGAFDYLNYFEYYIDNGILYITRIKAEEWYAYFGNYDVIVPSTLLGYPVMLDNEYYE